MFGGRKINMGFARRRPFLALVLLVIFSNVAGSGFNFGYNVFVILNGYMDESQKAAFWDVASLLYNVIAYPVCLSTMIVLLWPLMKCRRQLLAGVTVPVKELDYCRRRLVNLPVLQIAVNFLGWFPSGIFLPLVTCWVGGDHNGLAIWTQFLVSVSVTAVFTTAQTFFILEAHLIDNLYPDFFQDARPAEVRGVHRIPFYTRLIILWLAVAIMPLLAVMVLVVNIYAQRPGHEYLPFVAVAVAILGTVSGGIIFRLVGLDLRAWLQSHTAATAEIAMGHFEARILQKRPDEWGALTDHFNDMSSALGRAEHLRETFGQFVSPEVRDQIVDRIPGLEVVVQDITVLFADIRGFTKRCSLEKPERVRTLLNKFFTLAVDVIEDRGGLVNKFLGDGVMALFGSTTVREDHPDTAVASALVMLERLAELNQELIDNHEAPLAVGIGIHTGPALVGCFGANIVLDNGQERLRREFTAIGETVNLGQRLEQLTKSLGGPILIGQKTQERLRSEACLECLGSHHLPGSNEVMVVYKVTGDKMKT
jgi:adenylate cyclase